MKEKTVKDRLGDNEYAVRLGEDLWDKEVEALLFLKSQLAEHPNVLVVEDRHARKSVTSSNPDC